MIYIIYVNVDLFALFANEEEKRKRKVMMPTTTSTTV